MAGARPLAAIIVLAGFVAGCQDSSRHTMRPTHGTVSTVENKAIDAVIASPPGGGFGFFPQHPGRTPCNVPEGGPTHRSIKGVCVTRVSRRPGYSGQTLLVFTETWPWQAFHYGGRPRRPQTHTWQFVVLPSGKVALVTQSGDFPPQYVR